MAALDLIDGWPGGPRAAAVLAGGDVTDDRGDVWAPLRWASVTKLATALATLIAVDEGRLDLDAPVDPTGTTLRHLLAHASRFVDGRPTRRVYSNPGYETIAGRVAAAVGQPFSAWLEARVLEPLAMTETRLEGSPASGMVGPLADLVGLAGELQRPTLISPPLAEAMRTVAFPGLPGLVPAVGLQPTNDWGLGPEIRDGKVPHWTGSANSPATFGHFGADGGFVWVDPVAGVALTALTSVPFGPWALEAWPVLSDAVLASRGPGVRVRVTPPS